MKRQSWMTDEVIGEVQSGNLGRTAIMDQFGLTENKAARLRKYVLETHGEGENAAMRIAFLEKELKLKTQRVETLQLAAQAKEQFFDAVRGAIRALPQSPKYRPPRSKRYRSKRPHDAMLVLTDHHAGEVVSPDEMEGANEYNFEILCLRLWRLIHDVINEVEVWRTSRRVEDLWIPMLGDMLGGTIHEELAETNQWAIAPTLVQYSFVVAQALNILSSHFKTIHVIGLPGNHPRTTQRRRHKQRVDTNMDTMAYQMIGALVSPLIKANRVSMTIPASPTAVATIRGKQFLLNHGDDVKGWSGVPAYGMLRQDMKETRMRQRMARQRFNSLREMNASAAELVELIQQHGHDYWFMGHWHCRHILEGSIYVCPALIGANEYAKNVMHTIYQAEQFFGLVAEGRGLTYECPLRVQITEGEHGFLYDPDGVVGVQAAEALLSTHTPRPAA